MDYKWLRDNVDMDCDAVLLNIVDFTDLLNENNENLYPVSERDLLEKRLYGYIDINNKKFSIYINKGIADPVFENEERIKLYNEDISGILEMSKKIQEINSSGGSEEEIISNLESFMKSVEEDFNNTKE